MYNPNDGGGKSQTTAYAVFRNGVRVSELEYDSTLSARSEYTYWQGILKRWPDGSKLDILPVNYRYNRS